MGWRGGDVTGGGQQSGGGQYQQRVFRMSPTPTGPDATLLPVPGHLSSFDKWIDEPLPRGDRGDQN